MLIKISNMTELCCWTSRNWACWVCCAFLIYWVCKSSSYFFNFSSAMKFLFHASQKNMTCNHWMLTWEIFFANLHLHHFFSFSLSRQMFQVRHFACLVPKACNFVKKETLTQVLSCEFCETLGTHFLRTPPDGCFVVLHLFQCDGCYAGCFTLYSSFWFIFFH